MAAKSIRNDYLNQVPELEAFYNYPVQGPDFAQILRDKAPEDIDRKLLQTVIREQYEGIKLSEATQKHLDQLGQPNSFTITTGHQLVLFGGPMFTTYKVLTAIKLAAELQAKHPDYAIVPIFWIHTEDHDFAEINHYYPSFHERKTYEGAFQSMVGNHVLTEAIDKVKPAHFEDRISDTYQTGLAMKDAFRRYINELFGEYGVLMLDADDARLKARFQTVLKEEVEDRAAFRTVTETSQKMAAAGYALQIAPREINLFYLDDQGRNRIVAANGHYEAVDRDLKWQHNEMQSLIEEHPEHFSPNVSLRPLYQEMILPNLCYIGGWGELSYWLQLKGVFAHFGVNFPLLLPRMSGTMFTKEQLQAWEALGLSPEDIKSETNLLNRKLMPAVWQEEPFLAQQSEILSQIENLTAYIEQNLSSTLARSGEALKVKTARYLKNLEKKAHRVMRHRYPESFKQLKELKTEIQPDGMVQERVLSLASFPDHAPETIIKLAWDHCEPLNLDHCYMVLPD